MDNNNQIQNTVPAQRSSNGKKIVLFFLLGILLGGAATYAAVVLMKVNYSDQVDNSQATNDTSVVDAQEEKEPITEIEAEQTEFEEGVIQDEESKEAVETETETEAPAVVLPEFMSAKFGVKQNAGDHSIVFDKVERGVTFNVGTQYEKFYPGYIRAHFTITNNSQANKQYLYNNFTLEDGDGQLQQARVDQLAGEFGGATLIPKASKKGFVMFKTESNSGTLVWLPTDSPAGDAVRVAFKEKK